MKHTYFIHPSIAIMKRVIDLTFSIISLVLSLPLFIIIALLIKLSSSGTVFYSQLRVGMSHAGKVNHVHMTKFRTMVENAEAESGAIWASNDDNRLTTIGQFLRRTRLDELPQFINITQMDMLLIGSRPERPEIVKQREKELPFYSKRTNEMKPGITRLAQVYQGYDTCIDDVRAKIAYDFTYSLSLSKLDSWTIMETPFFFKSLLIMLLGHGR